MIGAITAGVLLFLWNLFLLWVYEEITYDWRPIPTERVERLLAQCDCPVEVEVKEDCSD